MVWRIDWKVTDEKAQLGAITVDKARDRGVSPGQCFSDLSEYQNHLEGTLKAQLASPTPRVSETIGPGWGLQIYVSREVPDDTDAAGP